jgi:hypothetical protein
LFFLQSGVLGGVLLFFFLLKMFGKTHGETGPASTKPLASPFSTPGLPSVHFLKHVSVCFAGGFADKSSGAWLNQSFIDACMNAQGCLPQINHCVLSFWHTATTPATILAAIQRNRAFVLYGEGLPPRTHPMALGLSICAACISQHQDAPPLNTHEFRALRYHRTSLSSRI